MRRSIQSAAPRCWTIAHRPRGVLRRRVVWAVRTESLRCTSAVGGIALRFPRPRIVGRTLPGIACGSICRSIRIRHRGRRAVLRKFALARGQACICVRVARSAPLVRPRRTIHLRIAEPASTYGAVHPLHREVRGSGGRSSVRHHGSILDSGRRPRRARIDICAAQGAVLGGPNAN